MAKRVYKNKKTTDTIQEIGEIKDDVKTGENWQATQLEVKSETPLEKDQGLGDPLVLRFFDYKANPLSFKKKQPTAQELFNVHLKQIEVELWKDGLRPEVAVEPRLMFSKDKTGYRIVIGARLSRGRLLREETKTLTQLINGNSSRDTI